MDLTVAEDIKKRWQEYAELYKKDLNDPDNHDGVITHLEPDILECEVKWALGNITMNKALLICEPCSAPLVNPKLIQRVSSAPHSSHRPLDFPRVMFPSSVWPIPYLSPIPTALSGVQSKPVPPASSSKLRSPGSAPPAVMTHRTPLSVGFLRQEYWGGLPGSPPGELPNPGIKLESPALQTDRLFII